MISSDGSTFLASLVLIGMAEIGDKSQIVCMALASRHRHWPVLLGAVVAFLILNTLAVVFGAGIAAWVPERICHAFPPALEPPTGVPSYRDVAVPRRFVRPAPPPLCSRGT